MSTMRAMVLPEISKVTPDSEPLELRELPIPEPGPGEIRLRILACGVCHTELDEIEGRTAPPELPVVLGHEVVGAVDAFGAETSRFEPGARVGVGWFYSSCGRCEQCRSGRENLCDSFKATGRDTDGGYAEYMVVPESSAYPIPKRFGDTEAAPLLCAGGVGYRSLRRAHLREEGDDQRGKRDRGGHSSRPGGGRGHSDTAYSGDLCPDGGEPGASGAQGRAWTGRKGPHASGHSPVARKLRIRRRNAAP